VAFTRRSSGSTGTILVILVDGEDLERWIAADDRPAVLRELHERAVFDLKR
jgi:phenylacetate-coenzyme A ligase PaaK-like adenylate-forming protein